jgi:4-amino-4-deoxy-L-arabinose transferase-like glycosyltransferase
VARNLASGRGYTVEWIEYHVGFRDEVRHVSELHGILRPLVLAPLFLAFGPEDGLVRLPGFTYAALTGLAAFAFARSRFGAGAGLLACLMVLGSPALASWAWSGTDDTGFAFFFLCTLWLATEGLDRPGGGGPRLSRAALGGCAAALALLEKQTGLYLPAALLVVCLLARRRGAGARHAALLLAPIGVAGAAYALRNLAAHGTVGFELAPLSWITKDQGIEGFFRLYESSPSLAGVLAALGPARIAEIAWTQLERFAAAVFLPWRGLGGSLHLLAPGLPSLLLHLRRDPGFAVPALAAALGAIAFLCGLYAMETRYFLMLIPLSAVSLAGCIARGLAGVGRGWLRHAARAAAGGAAAAVVGWSGVWAARIASGTALPAWDHRRLCPEAVAWLRANLAPDAVILTHNPWWVGWVTGRPAVAIPSGGEAPLAKVARHYAAQWAFLVPVWGREAAVARTGRLLLRGAPGLRAELAFAGSRCAVYRLAARDPEPLRGP